MPNRIRRCAIRSLTAVAVLGAAGVVAVAHAGATAEPGWAAPSMPVACTPEQAAAGDVASCLLTGTGLPETRGWPTPPFPTPVGATPAPWVDLKIGSAGPTVTAVQQALTAAGFAVDADGLFGALTGVAVTSFQTANILPATGVVDSATADALGVSNTVSIFPPPGWTFAAQKFGHVAG